MKLENQYRNMPISEYSHIAFALFASTCDQSRFFQGFHVRYAAQPESFAGNNMDPVLTSYSHKILKSTYT